MSLAALLVLVAIGAVFIVVSSSSLPPMVASHFVAGGVADASMPRATYVLFMALVSLGLPLAIGAALSLTRYLPASLINLPNRSFWLAPERIDATRRYLSRQGALFAAFLAAFLCFVHWQVVQANQLQPPQLQERPFIVGLALFILLTLIWAGVFVAHFRNART